MNVRASQAGTQDRMLQFVDGDFGGAAIRTSRAGFFEGIATVTTLRVRNAASRPAESEADCFEHWLVPLRPRARYGA